MTCEVCGAPTGWVPGDRLASAISDKMDAISALNEERKAIASLTKQRDELANLLDQYAFDGEFYQCCSVRHGNPHKEWCDVGKALAKVKGGA